MAEDVLIRVEGVSKKFCRSLKRSLWYGVKDIVLDLNPFGGDASGSSVDKDGQDSPGQIAREPRRLGSDHLRTDEFWAVKDVSFELRRGECLGLIGRNGAGKTTLLKMLNGLIKPDAGRIEMRGRVGALIALGAGFNPILTGRENIYVNGSVLGLTKREIDGKVDEIIEFAEIREFIDAPVQSYSSGMQVRLGFAVAAQLIEPDVLFLDEVLAVGDIGFVIKCLNTVRRLAERSAVVFVSHNMQFVSSFCTRVMLLDHGRCQMDTDEPAQAIDCYFEVVQLESSTAGTGEAIIRAVSLQQTIQNASTDVTRIRQGVLATLCIELDIHRSVRAATIFIYIMDETMSPIVCVPLQDESGKPRQFSAGSHSIQIPLGLLELASGKYSFTVAIANPDTQSVLNRTQGLHPFRVYAERAHWGRVVRPAVIH